MRGINVRVGFYVVVFSMVMTACSKKDNTPATPPSYSLGFTINGSYNGLTYKSVTINPAIKFTFTEAVAESDVKSAISFKDNAGTTVNFTTTMQSNSTVAVLQPSSPLM